MGGVVQISMEYLGVEEDDDDEDGGVRREGASNFGRSMDGSDGVVVGDDESSLSITTGFGAV